MDMATAKPKKDPRSSLCEGFIPEGLERTRYTSTVMLIIITHA
jgi:hypothetical protein